MLPGCFGYSQAHALGVKVELFQLLNKEIGHINRKTIATQSNIKYGNIHVSKIFRIEIISSACFNENSGQGNHLP